MYVQRDGFTIFPKFVTHQEFPVVDVCHFRVGVVSSWKKIPGLTTSKDMVGRERAELKSS